MADVICSNCGREFQAGSADETNPVCFNCRGTAAILPVGQASTIDALKTSFDVESSLSLPATGDQERETHAVFAAMESKDKSTRRYLVGDEIDRGGMGAILQSFDKDIRRQVAMKVMLSEKTSSREDIERFIEEAQITGQLEHPNIVPVHELGVDSSNQVFFTMKRVRGRSLHDVLNDLAIEDKDAVENYTLTALLNMFLKVCDGVGFAHSKGVVHRDLKPGNIMVGEFGEVLVMDWGLAKVRGREDVKAKDVVRTLRSETGIAKTLDGMISGTPSYMPPEQARGNIDAIDERSDIYSLGAVLHEMLCLWPPFRGKDALDVIDKVIQGEFLSPDESAPHRGIPRELSAICTKAMAYEKANRYATAEKLAGDVRLYLEGRAVSAKEDTFSESVIKLVRRNREICGTAAAALILIAVGTVWFVMSLDRQKNIAQANELLARQESIRAERNAQEAVEEKKKVEVEKARAERETERARAINKFLQDMLASADPAKSGRTISVTEIMDRSSENVEKAFGSNKTIRSDIHLTLGKTYMALGRLEKAEQHIPKAVELRLGIYGEDALEFLTARRVQGELLREQGKYVEAERLQREVLEKLEGALGKAHPDTLGSMEHLALVLTAQGKYSEAESMGRAVLEKMNQLLGDDYPPALSVMHNLASTLLRQGKYSEAETLYRQALERGRRIRGNDHPDTLAAMNDLAWTLKKQGKYHEAEKMVRLAVNDRKRVLGEDHPETLTSMNMLPAILASQGRYSEAETLYREVLEKQKQVLGEKHPNTIASMDGLAMSLGIQGKHSEAAKLNRAVVEGMKHALGNDHPRTLGAISNLAASLYRLRKYAEAAELSRAVVKKMKRILGSDHPHTLAAMSGLACTLYMQGKLEETCTIQQELVSAITPEIDKKTAEGYRSWLARCKKELATKKRQEKKVRQESL